MHRSNNSITVHIVRNIAGKAWRLVGCFAIFTILLGYAGILWPQVQADHIAAGKMDWISIGNRMVKFNIRLFLRTDEYRVGDRLPIVGDILDERAHRYPPDHHASLFVLDTGYYPHTSNYVRQVTIYKYKVLSLDATNNFMEVEVLNQSNNPGITYTYGPDDTTPNKTNEPPYNVSLSSTSRVLNIANRTVDEGDGGDGTFDFRIFVTPDGTDSPKTTAPLILSVPASDGTTPSFALPILDPEAGPMIAYLRFDIIAGLTAQPEGMTVTTNGVVYWDNENLPRDKFYAAHFWIESYADFGVEPARSSEIQCLLKILPGAGNNPPTLTISPAGPITSAPGSEVSFRLTTTSGDTGQDISLYADPDQFKDPAGNDLNGINAYFTNGVANDMNFPKIGTTYLARDIKFTPTAAQAGNYRFFFTATDAMGVVITKNIQVTITNSTTGTAPTLTAASPHAIKSGVPLSFNVTATDPDAGLLTISMHSGPAGSSFNTVQVSSGGYGTFNWTPTTNDIGQHLAVFEVVDTTGRVGSKFVDIYVDQPPLIEITSPLNGAMVAGSSPPSVNVSVSVFSANTVQSVTLLTNGVSFATDTSPPFAFTVTGLPKGLHTLTARANYSGAPSVDSGNVKITIQPRYTLAEIPTHGGYYSVATAINPSGQVAGYANESYYPPSGSQVMHALRWTSSGGITDLLDPWGSYYYGYPHKTLGWGINESGIVVGEAVHYTTNLQVAFKWNGSYTLLNPLSGGTAVASAINSNSVIVGTSTALVSGQYIPRATRWASNSVTAFNLGSLEGSLSAHSFAYGINSAGRVVGKSHSSDGPFRAYLTSANASISPLNELGTISLLTNHISEAWDVNNSNEVVGGSQVSNGDFHAFYRDSNGTMLDLGTFGGTFSLAYAINTSGYVVGEARNAQGSTRAFVYLKNSGSIQDLTALVPNTSWTLVSAQDINDDGKIVGWGYNQYGSAKGFVLTPTF